MTCSLLLWLTCRIRSTFHLVQPPLMRSRPVLGVITSTGTTTLFSLLILKRPTHWVQLGVPVIRRGVEVSSPRYYLLSDSACFKLNDTYSLHPRCSTCVWLVFAVNFTSTTLLICQSQSCNTWVFFQVAHVPFHRTAPTTLTWSQDVSANGNNRPVPQAVLPLVAPPAMSQAVPHPPSQAASTFVPPETPLATIRSVFLPFSPPVPSSLPLSQQRQVSASRHSGRASRSSFAYNQSPGPPGPNTTITPKTNKTSSSPESSNIRKYGKYLIVSNYI